MYLFSEKMLTSSSQYLHPEYLQPLPTTLDAKKSPLALLAQTCSSIGKDISPSKSIIPSISKKDGEKDKSASPEVKRPTSNNNSNNQRVKSPGSEKPEKPGFRTVPNKDGPPSASVSPGQSNEKSKSSSTSSPARSTESAATSSTISHSITSLSVSSTNSSNNQKSKRCSSRDGDNKSDSTHRSLSRQSPDLCVSSSSGVSVKPQINPSLSSFHGINSYPPSFHGFPFMPPGSALDQAALHGYSASLAAHAGLGFGSASAAAMAAAQSSALKQHQAAAAAALSPYVSYTRVRTPSGATTLVPVCRDPYCTNCQLTVQNSHLSSTCNSPGCAQCAHEKSLQNLTSLGMPGMMPVFSSASGLPAIPGFASLGQAAALSALYPHSALSAHQGLPFVCNWVSPGNEFCGKRFTTSEELLQHLRTHTTSVDAASSNFALGLNSAYHLNALNASGGLSPNSLRRSYPTSGSPGLLSANRYHPYKSALTSPSYPSSQTLPPLGPYYSPYALYSQRLGAAAVP